jgi:polysaccharide biosynthesis/export protein
MIRREALALIALCLTACSQPGPYTWARSLPRGPTGAERPLRVGERVQVIVHGQDTMTGEFEIRPAGEIVMPVAGRVNAAGRTPTQLAQAVTERLRGVLQDPRVTAVLAARPLLAISVLGEVQTPGRYELRDGEGVLEALARAGGLSPFADQDAIYVVRRDQQSARVRFRYRELAQGEPSSVGFRLEDGDIVIVE